MPPGPFYDEPVRWFFYRVQWAFDLEFPPYGASTLGELIALVGKELGTTPDAILEICRYPSLVEVREEAFRRFQKAIANVGGVPPALLESPLDSLSWLPPPKPQEKWDEVAKELKCHFSMLWPGNGYFWAFGLGYGVMLAVWVGLLYAFGFNQDPRTLSDWVLGGLFTLTMFAASALIPAAIAEWTSTRIRIPFESLSELVDGIRRTANPPIEDSMAQPIQSTIRNTIYDVAVEELGIPRNEVGPEFSLVPDDLRARWETVSERNSDKNA